MKFVPDGAITGWALSEKKSEELTTWTVISRQNMVVHNGPLSRSFPEEPLL